MTPEQLAMLRAVKLALVEDRVRTVRKGWCDFCNGIAPNDPSVMGFDFCEDHLAVVRSIIDQVLAEAS